MDIKISGQDGPGWTEERYEEAIEAFATVTDLVLEFGHAWAVQKSQ